MKVSKVAKVTEDGEFHPKVFEGAFVGIETAHRDGMKVCRHCRGKPD